jgi:hypothetical protein
MNRPKGQEQTTGTIKAPDVRSGDVDVRNSPLATAGVVVLMGTIVLTAVTVGAISNGPAPKAAPAHPKPSATLETFNSPGSACDPEFDLSLSSAYRAQQERDAQDCLDLYADSNVALVNYSLGKTAAKTLASDVQFLFNQATQDTIHIHVTEVEASDSAKKLFEQETPDSCVIQEPGGQGLPSYIAAETMSELNKYDKIIGVTSDPACEDPSENIEVFGGAAQGGSNRYAVEENAGKSVEDARASIIAHELGHLYGMGHSSTLTGPDGASLDEFMKVSSGTGGVLNLDKYISGGTYNEYGEHTIMGNADDDLKKNADLNIPQQYLLGWAYGILGKESPVMTTELDDSSAVVTFGNDTLTSSIAVLNLKNPLQMPNVPKTNDYYGQKFDRIAFVPEFKDGTLDGTRVYVLSDKDSVVDLGVLGSKVANSFTLEIGGKTVDVTVDPTNSSVSIKAAA